MAYNPFDNSKPDAATQDITQAFTSIRNNDAAIRDMAVAGVALGWVYSQSGGTAAEPANIFLTNGNERLKFVCTWSSGNITQIAISYANDGPGFAGAGDALGTWTFTYDGNGDLTASSVGGSLFAKLLPLLGKVKAMKTTYDAHIAATGTAVHGLGSISTQSHNNVDINGGSIDNTDLTNPLAIGANGAPPVDATRVREAFHDYGIAGNSNPTNIQTLEVDKYSHFAVQPYDSSTAADWFLAISGAPAAGKSHTITIELLRGFRTSDGKIHWPASFKWTGGSSLRPLDTTLESGVGTKNIFVATTRDGGVRWEVTHIGKGG